MIAKVSQGLLPTTVPLKWRIWESNFHGMRLLVYDVSGAVQQPSDLGTGCYKSEFQAKMSTFNLKVTAAIGGL